MAWTVLVRHCMVGTVLSLPTRGSHLIQLWVVRTEYSHLRDEVRNLEVEKLGGRRTCPAASGAETEPHEAHICTTP